MVEEIWG